MSYNKKTWLNGDLITEESLNNIENGIYHAHDEIVKIDSQIKDIENIKADKTTANNIQQQINNLVLGAVGDGNNAEVVQARGSYATLNDRLNKNELKLKQTISNTLEICLLKDNVFEINRINLENGNAGATVGSVAEWDSCKSGTVSTRLRTEDAYFLKKGCTFLIENPSTIIKFSYILFNAKDSTVTAVSRWFANEKVTLKCDVDSLIGFIFYKTDGSDISESDVATSGLKFTNKTTIQNDIINTNIDINNLSQRVSSFFGNELTITNDDVERKNILTKDWGASGYKVNVTNRLSTIENILCNSDIDIYFDHTKYKMWLAIYDENGTYQNSTSWITTSPYSYRKTDSNYRICLCIANIDTSTDIELLDSDIIIKQHNGTLDIEKINKDELTNENMLKRLSNHQSGIARIGTWNIPYSNKEFKKINPIIKKEGLNFLGIQEYRGGTDLDILSYYCDDTLHNYHYVPSGSSVGVLALTNYHKISQEEIPLDMHGGFEQRILSKMTILINGKKCSMYTVHLDVTPSACKLQIADVINILATDMNEYKIILGDFNIYENNYLDPFISAGYKIVNGKDGIWVETYKPEYSGTNSLDNIIVSNNIDILDWKMLECTDDISDHNGLIADLLFN